MLNDDESHEQVGSLAESAISQHEMYLSWLAAGFTPEQSLDLLKVVITEIMRGAA